MRPKGVGGKYIFVYRGLIGWQNNDLEVTLQLCETLLLNMIKIELNVVITKPMSLPQQPHII